MADCGVRSEFRPPMWVVVAALGALSLWLLTALRELVSLLIVGFCAAYLLERPLRWLERRGVRRSFGLLVLLAAAASAVLLLGLTAVPTVLREYRAAAADFPQYVNVLHRKLAPLTEKARQYLPAAGNLMEMPLEKLSGLGAKLLQHLSAASARALSAGYSLALTALHLMLLPFIVFYLALDFPKLQTSFVAMFPFIMRARVTAILDEIDGYVSAFVHGQLLVCLILTLLYGVGLALLRIELWHLVALIAGLGNMIPYFGTIFGVLFASLMAVVTHGDFIHVLWVWGLFAVVQTLTDNFISPRIQGGQVGLSPLAIMLALLVGGNLFGFLGVMLAVPGAAAVKVALRHLRGWVLSRY